MKETLTRRIRISFAVSIAALLLLTSLSFYHLNLLLNRSELVNHTNEVLLKLQDIVSGLKDAETGQRGYLLTGNPDFLEPYIGSYQKVFEQYQQLRKLTIDNFHQQKRLDTLKVLINTRYSHINTTIELEKKGDSDSAKLMVKTGVGKRIMDDIRRLVNIMSQEEINLRKERVEAVKASSMITPVLVAVFSGIALIFAVVFYFLINRDNIKRLEAEEKLEAATAELEESYEELRAREEQLTELNVQLEERVESRTQEAIHRMNQLRETESRYRLLIEGVSDYAIFMLDEQGTIVSWNAGAERLKGYKEHEIIGKHFSIFYPQEKIDAKIPDAELVVARETGKFEEEGWRLRKDGSVFWANVLITAIYNEQKKLIGFSKITRDLSERKKAEDNLRKVNTDLDSFVYIASHDLKAPIANLEGLLTTVQEEMGPACSEEISQLFTMMDSSIGKLKNTIYELSHVHHLQKEFNDDTNDIPILEVLAEVKNAHRDVIESTKARIYTDLETPTIRFSRRNMYLIVDNLISNSLRYKSPDRNPEILITTTNAAEWIVFSVKDNGLGIDPKKESKIFGMFQRLHSHVEGSGMGLYILKRILENAGGKIELESEVGKGSTFKLYFKKSMAVK